MKALILVSLLLLAGCANELSRLVVAQAKHPELDLVPVPDSGTDFVGRSKEGAVVLVRTVCTPMCVASKAFTLLPAGGN